MSVRISRVMLSKSKVRILLNEKIKRREKEHKGIKPL